MRVLLMGFFSQPCYSCQLYLYYLSDLLIVIYCINCKFLFNNKKIEIQIQNGIKYTYFSYYFMTKN